MPHSIASRLRAASAAAHPRALARSSTVASMAGVAALLLAVTIASAQSPRILWADRRINPLAPIVPSTVWSLLPLPDGRIVVRTPASVEVWSRSGELLQALGNRQSLRPVRLASTDPRGRWHVMSTLAADTVTLIDAATLRRIASAPVPRPESKLGALFTPDGASVLILSDRRIVCRSLPSFAERWSVAAVADGAGAVSYDSRLLVHTDGGIVTTRSIATGELVRRYGGVQAPREVGFGDSMRVVVAYTGCSIVTWWRDDGKHRSTLADRTGDCRYFAMAHDAEGRYLVTYCQVASDGDSTMRIWTPADDARIRDYALRTVNPLAIAAISSDAREIVGMTRYGEIVAIDLLSGEVRARITRDFIARVTAPAGGDDGAQFMVAGAFAYLHDSSGAFRHTLGPMHNYIPPVRATSDGSLFAVTDWDHIRVWVLDSSGAVVHSPGLRWVHAMTMDRAGTMLVRAYESTISISNARTGSEIMTLTTPKHVRRLALSRDGRRLAVGCVEGTVIVFDLALRVEQFRRRSRSSSIVDLDIADEAKQIIALNAAGELSIWSATDSIGSTRRLVGDSLTNFVVAPDRRTIVVGGDSIYLYSLPRVERITALIDPVDHLRQSYQVGYFPTLGGLITSSTDGDLIRWELPGLLPPLSAPLPEQTLAPLTIHPTITERFVTVAHAARSGPFMITLYDRLGRRAAVFGPFDASREEATIDLGELSPGPYVVALDDGTRVASRCILVRR